MGVYCLIGSCVVVTTIVMLTDEHVIYFFT